MEINIPQSATVSHELPIFKELAKDSNIPVSEIKARFRNKMLELHRKALNDPSILSLGGDNDELIHMAVNELRHELMHPEETSTDDEEYDKLMGFDPNEPIPGSDIFNQPADDSGNPAAGNAFGGMDDGGFGGDFGGDFGSGGIDNMDLGFSDEDMAAFDQVDGVNDDIGNADADSVNAMSSIEPGTENTEGDEPSPSPR